MNIPINISTGKALVLVRRVAQVLFLLLFFFLLSHTSFNASKNTNMLSFFALLSMFLGLFYLIKSIYLRYKGINMAYLRLRWFICAVGILVSLLMVKLFPTVFSDGTLTVMEYPYFLKVMFWIVLGLTLGVIGWQLFAWLRKNTGFLSWKTFAILISLLLVALIISWDGWQLSLIENFEPQGDYYFTFNANVYDNALEYKNAVNLYSATQFVPEDTTASIDVRISPSSLLYVFIYVLMVAALIQLIAGIVKQKNKPHRRIAIAIILLFLGFLFFGLLEAEARVLNPDSPFFIIFPSNFEQYNYFFPISQNLFLKLDPLLALIQALAAHLIVAGIYFALFIILLTVILGRVFCGWICPLGTLNQAFSHLNPKKLRQNQFLLDFSEDRPKKKERKLSFKTISRFQRWKYYVLIVTIVISFFGAGIASLVDPIPLITRHTSVNLIPAGQYAINAIYGELSESEEESFLKSVYEDIYTYYYEYWGYPPAGDSSLDIVPTHFYGFMLNFIIINAILLLNILHPRLWCRFLCPLGAMLGLLSRFSLVKVHQNDQCTHCMECESNCHGNAHPSSKDGFRSSECMMCMNCLASCQYNALDLQLSWFPEGKKEGENKQFSKKKNQDKKGEAHLHLTRRGSLLAIAAGALGFLGLRAQAMVRRPNPDLIRPPGAVEETEFLSRCTACGECMKVCPTNFLHPAVEQAGLEGLFTPVGIVTLGYCDYSCFACTRVCPTDAIQKLGLWQKQKTKIGLAYFDTNRCLPYAYKTECIVCEEMCPTSPKAIYFEEVRITHRDGTIGKLKQPKIDQELCIGCGICSYKCPVSNKPAVLVTNAEEDRAFYSKIFLESNTIEDNQSHQYESDSPPIEADPYLDQKRDNPYQ